MGNYLCAFFRTLWSCFQKFMDNFVGIFRSLWNWITKRKRERRVTDETLDKSAIEAQESFMTTPVTGRGVQTPPLVESDKLEDSRAVQSVSPLIISPPAAVPQKEARLSEVEINAGKELIRKKDLEEIDEIMKAFRRNDVAWMNRKLEDLKRNKKRTTQTRNSSMRTLITNGWTSLRGILLLKLNHCVCVSRKGSSEVTNEITRRYTHNTPSFLNASTGTPLSQNVNSLLYKEVGLRPMNPAYYKIAYDCGSDEEPTTSQNSPSAHQNPGNSSIKKRIANRRKAKGGRSHRRGHRH
ncbi:unnamed protein product [Cylicocyclus nassatus]|uniref:Uncharacterized protein n=1 Tax=Cylicocyclus nassatus TaxID=53992 RepID=A0AA36MHM2_CYLNA|nr:unnamed protein product [Cylicocyclus nassatus]